MKQVTPNKICVWTQTYGDNRQEIFEWKNKDTNLNYFISQFDHSLFSFHNCSEDSKKKILSFNFPYKETISYDHMSYQECFFATLKKLKSEGYTKVVYLEDDCFSADKDMSIYFEALHYITTGDYVMLNLSHFSENGVPQIDLPQGEKILEKLYVHKTTNFDIARAWGVWHFDNLPMVFDIDFYLDKIYDEITLNWARTAEEKLDIWNLEFNTNLKMQKIEIPRFIFNKRLFKNTNIIGRSSQDRELEMLWLNKRFTVPLGELVHHMS